MFSYFIIHISAVNTLISDLPSLQVAFRGFLRLYPRLLCNQRIHNPPLYNLTHTTELLLMMEASKVPIIQLLS